MSETSEVKLCPFLKTRHGERPDTGRAYSNFEIIYVDEPTPCLRERCAMWRLITEEEVLGRYTHGFCGLAGNP